MDGLFLPRTNDPEKPLYIVEVQFQPDEDLYYRLFGELFLYLKQYKPPHPWQVVVIYPTRSVEREQTLHFGGILALNRVRRIYLDELEEDAESSLGVGVVKLVIEPEQTSVELARRLIEQARQQLTDEVTQRDLIGLVETIIVYKLPQKSREEIEAMLGLSELKKTRFYQDVQLETKLEAIPRMLPIGLSFEQIAEALDLPLEVVQETAQPRLFHEQNVAAFIQLLNSQRTLFSPQDLADLEQLIAPLPDDTEELSKAIATWCAGEERASHLNVLRQIRQTLLNSTREQVSETNSDTPDSPLNKQMLLNVIHQNTSSN
jgi:predicted transposase/invertase (TIGR01784 family)